MTVYYVMIEGKPKDTNPESAETEGAYIDVWVKSDLLEDAVQKAKDYLKLSLKKKAMSAMTRSEMLMRVM